VSRRGRRAGRTGPAALLARRHLEMEEGADLEVEEADLEVEADLDAEGMY
jgi:hypothetical protein